MWAFTPGDERHLTGVERLVAVARRDAGSKLGDQAVLGPQADPLSVEQRAADGEAHRIPASAGTTRSSASRTLRRLVSRPASYSLSVSASGPTPLARLSTAHTAA